MPWPSLGDVPMAGTSVECGRPILTVFASGETVADVESQLRARVVELEKKLYID
jgi:predicted ATP-grasp superfamily ATP-dependent carboligase